MTATKQKKIAEDSNTQITLFKRHGLRTDLFGLGAIAFDLLTCGQSPERFYDYVRGYDNENTDIADFIRSYEQVTNNQSGDPGLVHVFSPFKHQTSADYAPIKIVELILKCTFYKAKNIYYNTSQLGSTGKKYEEYEVLELILGALDELGKNYGELRDRNPLTERRIRKQQSVQLETLYNRIEATKSLPIASEERLRTAFWYFNTIFNHARHTMFASKVFMAELLPQRIIVKNNPNETPSALELQWVTYKEIADYKKDMEKDLLYSKLTRDILNPYVPNYFAFLRRAIELTPTSNPNDHFKFKFRESTALVGDSIRERDWIVIDSKLYPVKSVLPESISLEGYKITKPDKPIRGLYFSNIDPCIYYLNMLATYIYQLFVAKQDHISDNQPSVILLAQIASRLRKDPNVIKIGVDTKFEGEFEPILGHLSKMYVQLIFCDDSQSYYQKSKNDVERFNNVADDLKKLQELIADYLNVLEGDLDSLKSSEPAKPDETVTTDSHVTSPQEILQPPPRVYFDQLVSQWINISV